MGIKEKIIAAMGVTIEDISEEAMIGILLDVYKGQKRIIQALRAENAQEREDLHNQFESIKRDRHEMRSNPLFGATGEFYFLANQKRIGIVCRSGQIVEVYIREKGIDFAAQSISPNEMGSK